MRSIATTAVYAASHSEEPYGYCVLFIAMLGEWEDAHGHTEFHMVFIPSYRRWSFDYLAVMGEEKHAIRLLVPICFN